MGERPRHETFRGTQRRHVDVATLFGARVAEPILASGHMRRIKQAGHMIASAPTRTNLTPLASKGPSTYGSRIVRLARPIASQRARLTSGMTVICLIGYGAINSPSTPEETPMHPSIHAKTQPDKIAFIMAGSGEAVTYRELDELSNQGAQLFRSLGLKAGDHIAIFMENNVRFMEICWAAQRSGLYYTAISSRLTAGEVDYIVDDCGAKVFITSKAIGQGHGRARRRMPGVRNVTCSTERAPGYDSLEDALADSRRRRSPTKRRLRHALFVGHDRPAQGRQARASPASRSTPTIRC